METFSLRESRNARINEERDGFRARVHDLMALARTIVSEVQGFGKLRIRKVLQSENPDFFRNLNS